MGDSASTGVVIRSHSDIHTVLLDGRTLSCRVRGRLRLERRRILTGDRVEVEPTEPGHGVINAVLERRTELRRPSVANVDQALILFTVRRPDLNRLVIDRLIVQVERSGLRAVLCLNKIDLLEDGEVEEALCAYRPAGYPALAISAREGRGLDEVGRVLADRTTVLAGPSGVGKTTLINALRPGLDLETRPLSARSERGRHTTRRVELFVVAGGLVADTPGFTHFRCEEMDPAELAGLFPEIAGQAAGCRFADCLHLSEPGCAVTEAVDRGRIAGERYESYVTMLEELREHWRNRY